MGSCRICNRFNGHEPFCCRYTKPKENSFTSTGECYNNQEHAFVILKYTQSNGTTVESRLSICEQCAIVAIRKEIKTFEYELVELK